MSEYLIVFGVSSGFNVLLASHGGTLLPQFSKAAVNGLGLGGKIRFGFLDFFQSHLLAVVSGFEGGTGTGVNVSGLDRLFLVTLAHGRTFFGGSNVDFINIESSNLLVNRGNHPSTVADTSGFKGETDAQQNVGGGSRQESHGEGRGNKLPHDGGNGRGDESSKKTSIEESLETIGDAKDIVFTFLDVQRGGTSGDKEARDDAQLTTDHKSGEVVALVVEEEVASALRPGRLVALLFRNLRDGKESNLHTFEHTNDAPECNGHNGSNSVRNTFPHGGLSVEQGDKSNGKGKDQQGGGEQDLEPEDKVAQCITGRLVGFDGVSRKSRDNVLNKV
mmetsp:Transcript_10044/g.19328  ORF Transcript_10044/g.19328 Transcript_10044/m.19328 type:complete len:333 (-) Transcript_10044:702-1700(-)